MVNKEVIFYIFNGKISNKNCSWNTIKFLLDIILIKKGICSVTFYVVSIFSYKFVQDEQVSWITQ